MDVKCFMLVFLLYVGLGLETRTPLKAMCVETAA